MTLKHQRWIQFNYTLEAMFSTLPARHIPTLLLLVAQIHLTEHRKFSVKLKFTARKIASKKYSHQKNFLIRHINFRFNSVYILKVLTVFITFIYDIEYLLRSLNILPSPMYFSTYCGSTMHMYSPASFSSASSMVSVLPDISTFESTLSMMRPPFLYL